MKNYLMLIFLAFSIQTYSQSCSRQIAKNEYDPIKKIKNVETKVNIIYGGWSTAYSIKFLLNNGKIFAQIVSSEEDKVTMNSEIGFLFEKDTNILSTFHDYPTSKLLGNQWFYGNKIEFSIDEFKKFTNLKLKKANFYGAKTNFEISDKHADEIMQAAKCFAQNIDFNKDVTPIIPNVNSKTNLEENNTDTTASLVIISEGLAKEQNSYQECREINKNTDKFTGVLNFSSPRVSGISFYKEINTVDTIYYAYLKNKAATYTFGSGVILLLKSGKKLEFPDKVDVSVEGTSGIASTLIRITRKQMELISEDSITDFRLYIYDKAIVAEDGEKLKNYARCLLNAK